MFNKNKLKLTLSALLLAASTSAYAQDDEPAVVELANGGGTVTWSQFVEAINDPNSINVLQTPGVVSARENYGKAQTKVEQDSIANATKQSAYTAARTAVTTTQTAYNNANQTLTNLNAQANNMVNKTERVTDTWLTTAISAATSFRTAFLYCWNPRGATKPAVIPNVWYAHDEYGYLTIAFEDPGKELGGATLEEVGTDAFVTYVKQASVEVTGVEVYMAGSPFKNTLDVDGVYDVVYNFNKQAIANDILTSLNTLQASGNYTKEVATKEYSDLLASIQTQTVTVQTALDTYNKAIETRDTAEQEAEEAEKTLSASVAARVTAATAVATAINNAQANAVDSYNEVKLTSNITATKAITKAYTGSIDAQNHIINITGLPEGTYLFSNFRNAHLANAIINGRFAQNGAFNHVAVWRGTNGTYYDEDGVAVGTINNIGQLAYQVRDLEFFGANIADKKLVAWSTDSKVYDITAYQTDATTQFYTNIADNKFVNNPLSDLPVNTFYESKTNDFGNIANVIYNKTCANVEINDKNAFYCPFDITATNVTIKGRSLNKGYNTVCMPFELNRQKLGLGADDLLCVFDVETAEKFWFTKVAGTIAANTPALIYLNEAISELSLSGVTIKQTEADQLVEYEGSANDKSAAYGLFKNATADEIRGASQAAKVYGLQGGNTDNPKFNPAGTANFGAFRMVIASEIAGEQAAMGAPLAARSIGIVDEKGIEINVGGNLSGVEIVDMEASALDVKGGQGEIIITTDANYGLQTVYSIDGKAVATVEVVEGTNTVNVQSGLYIVMGQKVMVK